MNQDKPMALVADALDLQGSYTHAAEGQRASNARASLWDGTGTY